MATGEVHVDTEFSRTQEEKNSYIVLPGTYPSSSLRMSCGYRKTAEQKTDKESIDRKTKWKKGNMTSKTTKKKEPIK